MELEQPMQQTFDYLTFLHNLKEMFLVESDEQLVELLVRPKKVLEEVESREMKSVSYQDIKDTMKKYPKKAAEALIKDMDDSTRSIIFVRLIESLPYKRLRWSLDFMNNYGRGSIDNGDFGYLGDILQTSADYVANISIPVLTHLGLVDKTDNSICLTDKWYKLNRQ